MDLKLHALNCPLDFQKLTLFSYLAPPHIADLKLVHLFNNIVSISCVTIGTPESVVDWIDLTPLPAGFFIVHNGNLRIEKKYINNMKFLCNASNVYGWMTKHVAGNVFLMFPTSGCLIFFFEIFLCLIYN
jgi:hypothetical protein